jgi:hypothetical protein
MNDVLTQNHYDMFGDDLDLENEVIGFVKEPQIPFVLFQFLVCKN